MNYYTKLTSYRGAAAVIAILLALLACNMPQPQLGGPEPPPSAPQPSEDALESFEEKWRNLNFATPSGPFSITFTEAELTSAMAEAIEQQEVQGEDIPISDPRVVLQDGKIYMYSQVHLDVTSVGGLIIAVPSIGSDGLVNIEIESAEFGPVDVDTSMMSNLASEIERAINEPIIASPFNITLSQISAGGGQLTVDGTIAP